MIKFKNKNRENRHYRLEVGHFYYGKRGWNMELSNLEIMKVSTPCHILLNILLLIKVSRIYLYIEREKSET